MQKFIGTLVYRVQLGLRDDHEFAYWALHREYSEKNPCLPPDPYNPQAALENYEKLKMFGI